MDNRNIHEKMIAASEEVLQLIEMRRQRAIWARGLEQIVLDLRTAGLEHREAVRSVAGTFRSWMDATRTDFYRSLREASKEVKARRKAKGDAKGSRF